jgi:hypothetical protein
MRVLMDYHHHDLWESMELLCARLGWELYRPMGMDWFDNGYWNFERHVHGDAVAKQYLTPWGDDVAGKRYDPSHKRWIHLLTLEQARDLKIDVVIASVAHNHEGFARLAGEIGATFGIHIGNVRFNANDMLEDRWDLAKFGIVTATSPAPIPVPHVTVHQEFSLEDFHPSTAPRYDHFRLSSFVNCFAESERVYSHFRQIAALSSEMDWRVYGSYGSKPEDEYAAGNLHQCLDIANAMRESNIALHAKHWSDGYGFVIHNWFAVGRPVLGYYEYYKSQLAGPLWQEGVTSFDIGGKSPAQVVELLRGLSFEQTEQMGAAAAKRFRELVSFDEEEVRIRNMFANVL